MADIVLTGNTSGAITVAAPAVAGTNTLTLPASTGTVITSATAAADVPAPTQLSTASGSAPSYSARAWVNFNGSGTVAILDSGNVSSITDNGTGNYTMNFATAMPDANYSYAGGANYTSTSLAGGTVRNSTDAKTTAAFQFHSVNIPAGVAVDATDISMSIFR